MNELTIINHNEQRILTTAQIAEAYETNEKLLSNNFNNNKEHYTEGKHYYYLQGDELKGFLQSSNLGLQNSSKIRSLYLWTEKGALLHAKSLGTDKAWDTYDKLVENYFSVKEQQNPMCLEDVLIAQLNDMKAMKQQLNQVNHNALVASSQAEEAKIEIQAMRDAIVLDHDSWRKDCNSLINRISKQRGGTKEAYSEVRDEAYKLTEQRAGANLKQRVTNKQDRLRREGLSKSKVDAVSKVDAIADDKKLKEIYIAVVKEMAIKYGVA